MWMFMQWEATPAAASARMPHNPAIGLLWFHTDTDTHTHTHTHTLSAGMCSHLKAKLETETQSS